MTGPAMLVTAAQLLAAPITPPPAACTGCPTPWVVHAATNAYNPVSIVFLSDGFTVDTIETYRCAVRRLTDDLLSQEPWKSLACHLNVYRLDFVGVTGGIPTDCPTACERRDVVGNELTPMCSQGFDLGAAWAETACPASWRSFGTHACENAACRLLWPSAAGEDDALALASTCTPDQTPVAAIVVAASLVGRGGGDAAAGEGPGLAVVDLGDVGNAVGQSIRLSHELGHAFGLLDEYSGEKMDVGPAYQCGRNLFRDPPPTVGCESDPVWMADCDLVQANCSQCQPAHNCSRVCCPTKGCSVQLNPTIGLYEGGFYESCGYWHASESCRMEGGIAHFCSVCERYIFKKASWAGVGACEAYTVASGQVELLFDGQSKAALLKGCPELGPLPHGPPGPLVTPSGSSRRWQDWPRVGGCFPEMAGPGTWRATVVKDGVVGEVPVRRATIPIVTFGGVETSLELDVVVDGSRRTNVWRLFGREVRPTDKVFRRAPDGTIVVGRLRRGDREHEGRGIVVVDDVRGDRWEALSLRKD